MTRTNVLLKAATGANTSAFDSLSTIVHFGVASVAWRKRDQYVATYSPVSSAHSKRPAVRRLIWTATSSGTAGKAAVEENTTRPD